MKDNQKQKTNSGNTKPTFYLKSLFQQIQNITTLLCVPLNTIIPFFNKAFKSFTKLLYCSVASSLIKAVANIF